MEKDTRKIVSACRTCLRHNSTSKMEPPARSLNVSTIFERIGIDLIFGLPLTNEGFHGICVITEYLTRFPWAKPIKSKTAEEIATVLLEYIATFGPPGELLSDQGREFLNETVEKLITGLGVEHRVTSSYSPRTNGLTENFNGTLVNCIKKHAESDPTAWSEWIPFVLLAYRSKIHSSTGFTPFELMFGVKMRKFDEELNKMENDDMFQRSIEIRELVENTRKNGRENLQKSQEKSRNRRDKRTEKRRANFQIGNHVYKKIEGLRSKMCPKYTGPYEITGITKLGNFWLKTRKGKQLKQSQPANKLKACPTPETTEELFDVEEVRDHRMNAGTIEYLVKWLGYTEETWEPEENFENDYPISQYWAKQTKKIIEDDEGSGAGLETFD